MEMLDLKTRSGVKMTATGAECFVVCPFCEEIHLAEPDEEFFYRYEPSDAGAIAMHDHAYSCRKKIFDIDLGRNEIVAIGDSVLRFVSHWDEDYDLQTYDVFVESAENAMSRVTDRYNAVKDEYAKLSIVMSELRSMMNRFSGRD